MNEAFRKFDLTGKTAVVTGGGTGIGYYMARGLARSGARVMIAARRENVIKEAAEKLTTESDGNQVLYHKLDLADKSCVDELAAHALKTLGGVDIFIGNAAADTMEHVWEIKDESIETMCEVNIGANVRLVRAFVQGMRKKKWGRVLFSSSGSTVCASPREGMAMYTAVKGALNCYARTAATELGRDGITVNSILLGFFPLTDMAQQVGAFLESETPGAATEFFNTLFSMTAVGRGGTGDEIEGLVQFLASDAGGYVTGTHLPVDGGLTSMLLPYPAS